MTGAVVHLLVWLNGKLKVSHERRSTAQARGMLDEVEFFYDNYEELLRLYPEEWVAILNERVVGSGSDADELIIRLRDQGVPLESLYVNLVTANEEMLILTS